MSFRKGHSVSSLASALKRMILQGRKGRAQKKQKARRRFLEQLESRAMMAANIIGLSPVDGAVNWPLDTNLTLTFDTNVVKGQGNIHVVRNSTGTLGVVLDVNSPNVVVAGATVTIDLPENLLANEAYHVRIDNGAFLDTAVVQTAGATLLTQDFELLPLLPFTTQSGGDGTDFTLVPPLNYSVDNSLMEPNGIPGVPEWRGWSFADKNSWIRHDNQSRDEFTLGSGTVAVADPDEYDDAPGDVAAFNSKFISRPILLTGVAANSLVLEFDSSFRPENSQVGVLEVRFDGGGWEQLLRLDPTNTSNTPSTPTLTNRNMNERLVSGTNTGATGSFGNVPIRSVNNPVGATTAEFRWSVTGSNTFWWALDNMKVTGEVTGVPFLGINNSTTWNLDLPTLTVSVPTTSINENGGTVVGTVSRTGVPQATDFVVALSSSDTSEATVPATVTIPAGQLSTTFLITGVDDSIADRTQTVVITATAATYIAGNVSLDVTDDESEPQIVSLSPADNATDVDYRADLVMTFNMDVKKGSGRIYLVQTSTNVAVASIDVNSAMVTVAGATVTINPPINLNGVTGYHILIDDGVFLDTSATVTPNAVLLTQNFNLLSLQAFTSGAGGDGTDFTRTPPAGYAINNAAMPGPSTSDFYGWSFADRGAWATRGGSARSAFTNGSGVVAVADATLWNGVVNPTDSFNSVLTTEATSLVGVTPNSVSLEFDVAIRGNVQVDAFVEVSYNGGANWTRILQYNGTDSDNSKVVINSTGLVIGSGLELVTPLANPVGGTSLQFRFSSTGGANGWFAIDNIKVTGAKQGVAFRGISSSSDWNFVTGVVPALTLTVGSSSIGENGGTAVGTVSRNSGTVGDITVNLVSSDTSDVTVPASVVIPAGSSSVTFTIAAVNDAIIESTQTIALSATSLDFISGAASITVIDDDFQIVGLSPVDNLAAVPVGSNLEVTFNTNVKKGNGFVHIIRTSDGKSAQSIDVQSAAVTVSGAVVTINPSADLRGLTDYYVSFERGAILTSAPIVETAARLLTQDFELLTLKPAVLETVGLTANGRDFTEVPPAGYVVDNSLMPLGGVPEWNGWTFAAKSFWETQGGQGRSTFSRSQGTIAVGEVDEWDDVPVLNNTFNSFFTTSPVDLSNVAGNSVVLEFDSSFRPENIANANNQTGVLDVSYDGGTTWSNLFTYDRTNTSHLTTALNVNERKVVNVPNPTSGSMKFRYGLTGTNDYWWAIDNIVVTGNTNGIPNAGISNIDATSWNFTTAEANTLSLSVAPAPISENGGTATVTVTRNLGTTGDLVVALQSSDPSSATVPATVTILDGSNSATFTITAVDDAIAEGMKNVVVTASTSGFVNGTASVSVSDNEIADVVVSELMYRPGSNGARAEWIEIVNRGTTTTDVSDWRFDDEDLSNWGRIPSGTVLAPGQVAVFFNNLVFANAARTIALDAAGFRDLWNVPAGALVVPIYWGDLADAPSAIAPLNENLVLVDSANNVIDRANYDDNVPTNWPASQVGVSIYVPNYLSDNDSGASWLNSVVGVDGALNPDTVVAPAVSAFNVNDRGSPGTVPTPVALATPSVTVTSGSVVYNNAAYVASATVTGNNLPLPPVSFVYYSDAAGTVIVPRPTDVGTYFVRAFSAANSGNNAATSSIATFSITPFALTASGTAGNKVYDALDGASVTISLAGVFAGDTVTGSAAGTFADKNVANGKTVTIGTVTLAGADAGNYTVGSAGTTTADVTPAPLTAVGTAANRVYDATTGATTTVVLSGILLSDVVTGSVTGAFDTKNVGTGKTVTLTGYALTGADAANYSVTGNPTTSADITAAVLVASFTANNKPFDDTTVATIASRSLSGVIGSEVVTISGGSATFADKGVGNNKTVNATGLTIGGADAGNYTFNATATTQANITPTVFNRQLFYKGSSYASQSGGTLANPNLAASTDTSKVLAQSSNVAQTLNFASNVINSAQGINGIVLDIAGLVGTSLSTSDFGFRVSPTGAFNEAANPPSGWAAAPVPTLITVMSPGTPTTPARVRIEWNNNQIQNQWLQIRVLPTTNTGLPSQQTFYLGHLLGEVNGLAVGGTSGALQVTNADINVVRPLIGTNATVTSAADITKNGLVQNSDITQIRSGVGVRQLRLITIPVAGSGNEGVGNGGGSGGSGGGSVPAPGPAPEVGAPVVSPTVSVLGGSLGTVVEGVVQDGEKQSSATALSQPRGVGGSFQSSSSPKVAAIDSAIQSTSKEIDGVVDDLFSGLANEELGRFFK